MIEYRNRHFPKEDIEVTNRHMERCLISVIIREMQIKSKMNYHSPRSQNGYHQKPKISKNNKCWRGYDKKGTLVCF